MSVVNWLCQELGFSIIQTRIREAVSFYLARRRVVEGKADDKEDVCASDAVLDCDNYTMRRKETCK